MFSTKQKVGESLKNYMKRFTEEMSILETYDLHIASLEFCEEVTPGTKMHKSFVKIPPIDMREVLARADGIIRLEEEEFVLSKRTTATISTLKHLYEPNRGPKATWAYGTEVVIPTEIGLPTIRTVVVNGEDNDQKIACNLDLIKEQREVTRYD